MKHAMLSTPLKFLKDSPLLVRFVLFLVLLVFGSRWLFNAYLDSDLPPDQQTLTGAGLTAPVRVQRDAHGVPSIEARTDNDAFFAIGYVHAQDRLWQLELQRRMIHGELSEAFGKTTVTSDIFFRTLDLYGAARTAWPALSPQAQASLKSYTLGLNAALAATRVLPVEFGILGVKPRPWTELDCLAWLKMFAFNLGGNYSSEITRFVASQKLPEAKLRTFFPDYPASGPTTVSTDAPRLSADAADRAVEGLVALQDALQHDFQLGLKGRGSNAWAVSGRHTADGAALLATDPHLALQIPSIWYAIRARGDKLDVAGMGLAGLPIVFSGRNDRISWGGTSMMADTQDLMLERLDPLDPTRYEDNGRMRPFEQRTETIAIKTRPPEVLNAPYRPIKALVRSTRHGPVISDQFQVFEQPVTMRWVALEPGDTSYEALFRVQYAGDWATFTDAWRHLVAPAMNLMYADRGGNIGYLGAGRIPVRKQGQGMAPVPGWNDDFGLKGYVPFEALPRAYNPPSGFLVNANNKVVDDRYPYFISSEWSEPARAQRILDLLQAGVRDGRRLTVQDMERIQADSIDLAAADLVRDLGNRFKPLDADQARAIDLIRRWNGDMGGDNQAAAIFNMWMAHLRKHLFHDKLQWYWNKPGQASYLQHLTQSVGLDGLHEILTSGNSPWCGQGDDATPDSCNAILQRTLRSALIDIRKLSREQSMDDWRWDQLQRSVYVHRPFSDVPPLNLLFEQRVPVGGSPNTINVAAPRFDDKKGFVQGLGSSSRQVISMGRDRVVHHYMNCTGQSGNVISPHYDDMVEPFSKVEFLTFPGSAGSTPSEAAR